MKTKIFNLPSDSSRAFILRDATRLVMECIIPETTREITFKLKYGYKEAERFTIKVPQLLWCQLLFEKNIETAPPEFRVVELKEQNSKPVFLGYQIANVASGGLICCGPEAQNPPHLKAAANQFWLSIFTDSMGWPGGFTKHKENCAVCIPNGDNTERWLNFIKNYKSDCYTEPWYAWNDLYHFKDSTQIQKTDEHQDAVYIKYDDIYNDNKIIETGWASPDRDEIDKWILHNEAREEVKVDG